MLGKTVVDAELTVGFMNFKESYVSTVTCVPFVSVQVCVCPETYIFVWLVNHYHYRPLHLRRRRYSTLYQPLGGSTAPRRLSLRQELPAKQLTYPDRPW